MITACLLLLSLATFGQSLRGTNKLDESDTVTFVNTKKFGTPKKIRTPPLGGHQHFGFNLIARSGGELILHHDIERGQYDPQWYPYLSTTGALGYMDKAGRFSALATYTVANNVLGTGIAQLAGIRMTVKSLYCHFNMRTDATGSYDCGIGLRTSFYSIYTASMDIPRKENPGWSDNLHLYVGATLRTEADQKNYSGFQAGIEYTLRK